MALKTSKQATAPELVARSAASDTTPQLDINLEDAIADELLDSLDWSKVRAALIRKAPAKLFAWLTSGNNTPINISPFPELAQLPSRDDERAA